MSQPNQLSPVRILLELERRSRESAAELPQKLEILEMWNGIAFRVKDKVYIAPMAEVSEILDLPALTRVPNSKSWVLGIANVRGSLLPIMDLPGFLTGQNTKPNKRSRVLVVNHELIHSGLLVDEVYGMRHFERDSWSRKLPKIDRSVAAYVDRCYKNEERAWPVFSMHKLAESPLFHHAGI